MKTKKGWEEEQCSFDSYCSPGDEIDSAIYFYFLGCVPPAKQGQNWFLCGEASFFDGKQEKYMKFVHKGKFYFFEGYAGIKN